MRRRSVVHTTGKRRIIEIPRAPAPMPTVGWAAGVAAAGAAVAVLANSTWAVTGLTLLVVWWTIVHVWPAKLARAELDLVDAGIELRRYAIWWTTTVRLAAQDVTELGIVKVSGTKYAAVVARGAGHEAQFGTGLSRDELEWLLALVEHHLATTGASPKSGRGRVRPAPRCSGDVGRERLSPKQDQSQHGDGHAGEH